MLTPLSEERTYILNQSADTRKILEAEARMDAQELKREKEERLEKEYQESVCVGEGRLRYEWTETGTGKRVKHQKTGHVMLDGDPVVDGDVLTIHVNRKPVNVTSRYIYVGQLREVRGAWGDDADGKSYELLEGIQAEFVEEEPEAEPTGWHLKYKNGLWRVVKNDFIAGEYIDPEQAQDLAKLLNVQESYAERNANNIKFRSV